ncbi:MAG: HAD family hydrolase [Bacteroidota bacterium]
MNKAVFLDRDGVINIERSEYTFNNDDVLWVADIAEAIQVLKNKGYLLIVITNQSGIAKSIYTHNHVEIIHNRIKNEVAKGAITEIYYCPHHPDFSKCLCRKPDSLMVEKSLARFNINPNLSFFVGDKQRDVDAGEKAGVKGVLIEQNTSILEWAKTL